VKYKININVTKPDDDNNYRLAAIAVSWTGANLKTSDVKIDYLLQKGME
jgi:hypothetical protein